jgi:hypothetical protein
VFGAKDMQGQKYWIERGQLVPEPAFGGTSPSETVSRHRSGAVRVTTGPLGTEIRWAVFAPNFASLYFAMEWMESAKAPFILRYFLSGWFEDVFDTPGEAIARIEQVLAKSDLHFSSRAFVKELKPDIGHLPPLLRDSFADHGEGEADYAVDCVYEETLGRFRVERVGAKSAIAQFYGQSTVPYPCINGGVYDDAVSAAYASVVRSGELRYDHVLAAMVAPDSTVLWIPYQRVIVPRKDCSGRPGVSVIAEVAKVDIQII